MYIKFAYVIILCVLHINSEIINESVVKRINIETQLVRIDAVVIMQNTGSSPVNSFMYTCDPDVIDHVVYFANNKNQELLYENYKGGYKVSFDKPLMSNATYSIRIETVYIDRIFPLYKTLNFDQDQFVTYKGNLLYYSEYATLSLKTSFMWPEEELVELSHPPHNHGNNSLIYFQLNVPPFSYDEIKIIFKNNIPFFNVNLERWIYISHFGKISIEDRITIKNKGSKLIGPYERNVIKDNTSYWWQMYLPASAEHVQYFDTLGNNSKSQLLYFKDVLTLKFQPRYPLYGGWKTFYIVKYQVPSYEYLHRDLRGNFVLKMRPVDHVIDDVIIRDACVKVVLPQAAQLLGANLPLGFKRLKDETIYTAMCYFGRPTIVLKSTNIVENYVTDFAVEYSSTLIDLLRVPFLIVVYIEITFVFLIVLSHVKYNN